MIIDDEDKNVDPIAYVREKFKIAPEVPVDPELAKSKYEADEYIKMVVRQKDELKTDYLKLKSDYDARAKLEELYGQLKQPQEEDDHTPVQPALDETKLETLIENKFKGYQAKQKAQENEDLVKSKLKEQFGNKYTEVLKNKMDELELTSEELTSLAQRSPKAFFRTLGLDAPKSDPFQAPPPSTYRSSNTPRQEEQRTWSYYQKLKETNPRAWLDPKIQTQMYQDSQKLGSAFADGDFNQYNERIQ